MSPRTVRTFTTGAVASVALAVTGTAVVSANQDDPTRTIQATSERQAPATVGTDRAASTAPRGQAVSAGLRDKALRTASLTDIPPAALAAYQRAADSMASASPGCHLTWPLLAAVGQVESDHGRTSARNAKGIVGVPLDGKGVKLVADTDAGQLDGDSTHDRAVGPMQILPSTWATIAVDGDGDGKRDPQDIDDAALAAAVYLCGNGDDLATDAGTKAAVRSYNNSASYVALVMAVAQAYAKDQSATYAVGATSSGLLDFRSAGSSYAGAGANDADRLPVAKPTHTSKARTSTTGAVTQAPQRPSAPKPGSTPPVGNHPTPGNPAPGTPKPPVWKTPRVPDVTALEAEKALEKLKAAGYPGARTDVYDPTTIGQVITQSVAAGARANRGTTVTVTVSLGPVPDVVGLSYAAALAALQGKGLVVAVDPDGVTATDTAVVTAQTPDQSSTRVAQGSTVTLTLEAPPAG
ncbi:hypothetical protein GCM10011519_00550 [Marmoricola endophyticus]|uniref:PASTA domain-containing protein n=1 Tax=Marmoricola endophyticus TaxID=2040280 RepID=A0A917B980_9ACTN|nr:lytic transglycosylase domain-containing protein [Marmoricola endophyticus]GGF31009.1 hypothetical protein GCM10011519_00550 [Marmoricola endophyticus]